MKTFFFKSNFYCLAANFVPASVQGGSPDLEAGGFSDWEVLSENNRPVVDEDIDLSLDEDSGGTWLNEERLLLTN